MAPTKKSDDSALQDAEAARQRRASGGVDAASELDSLTEELQDAAAVAKAGGADAGRVAMLEKNFERLLSIVEEIKKNQTSPDPAKLSAPNKGIIPPGSISQKLRCQHCGQMLSVCNGEHVVMNVMPMSAENLRFFSGIMWNGVRYYGKSVIPKSCVHDIASTVRHWEFGERVLQHGRTKVIENGQHKTGMFIFDEQVS